MAQTTTKTTKNCPLCRLPLATAGRYIVANDDAGAWFVFALCMRCRQRLDKLPVTVQIRQQDLAFFRMAKNPDAYYLESFADELSARMACALIADS